MATPEYPIGSRPWLRNFYDLLEILQTDEGPGLRLPNVDAALRFLVYDMLSTVRAGETTYMNYISRLGQPVR